MARTRSTKQTTQKPAAPKGRTSGSSPLEAENTDRGTAKRETQLSRASTNTGQTMSTAEEESSYSADTSMHRRIAVRAFILYLESGCRHGNDLEHWFEAEREVKMQ